MNQKLLITSVSKSGVWYENKQWTCVDFLREDDEYYWSREPAGYSNIVFKDDAIIVQVPEEE